MRGDRGKATLASVAQHQTAANLRPFTRSLPFLMHCIVARMVETASAQFAVLGLNVADARVLLALMQAGEVRVGDLSEVTCITQSTLSHVLRRLAMQGLVTRTRAATDNRAIIVRLTPAGGLVARECVRLNAEQDVSMASHLTPRDGADLRRLLENLFAGMNGETSLDTTQNASHTATPG